MKIPDGIVCNIYDILYERRVRAHMDTESVGYRSMHRIDFPEPKGININMMPIDMWNLRESLPENLQQYNTMIWYSGRHLVYDMEKFKKIAYLTVHEEIVPVGKSHRRPGVHVEQPNNVIHGGV